MWDITIHPPSGPKVFASTRSFLPSMWEPHQIHPLWGPTSLLSHHLVSTPLWEIASSLAHSPVSSSDTLCNNSGPLLADIVLFGLSFLSSPQGFKMRGEGFHTLIKGVLFSSNFTIHPWGPASSLALVPFSNRCGTPVNSPPPPWGPASLLAHHLVSTLLRGTASGV